MTLLKGKEFGAQTRSSEKGSRLAFSEKKNACLIIFNDYYKLWRFGRD